MGVCFSLLVGGHLLLRLDGPVTLAWSHSVEQVRIEEDYRADAAGLHLTEVRTEGPGAGLDLPRSARFDGRWWRHVPALPAQAEVVLAHSRFPGGYTLCQRGDCRALAKWTGVADAALVMRPCASEP